MNEAIGSPLRFEGVWSPPLRNLRLELPPGLHVVLGSEADGTAALIELCAGVRVPRRGLVSLAGRHPHSSAELRRRTASLLADERGAASSTAASWWARVASRRMPAGSVPEPPPGLVARGPRGSIGSHGRRQLALELALSHPGPELVALHDPLGVAGAATAAEQAARISALAERSIVVVTTASLGHARMLGGSAYALERGVIARRPPSSWPGATTPGLPVALRVDCDAPKRLLVALAAEDAVHLVHFDAEREPSRLQLRGPDLDALSLAVCRAAEAAGANVWCMGPASLDLVGLHAASAGLARAAYHAARAVPAPTAPRAAEPEAKSASDDRGGPTT